MARTLAIGDIHGCIDALTSLLDFVALRPDDTIVTLGDYVDRGPNSRAVIDRILALKETHNLIALRGNHEIMLLDSRVKASWNHAWLGYGGDATLRSYAPSSQSDGSFDDIPQAHIDFLENELQSYYESDTHFFVHAYADAQTALEDQSDPNLYWRKFSNPERHCSGKIMVCGHTAQVTGLPLYNGNAICIDTWAYGEGWLSCLDTESGQIWQANEAGDRRTLTVDELRQD